MKGLILKLNMANRNELFLLGLIGVLEKKENRKLPEAKAFKSDRPHPARSCSTLQPAIAFMRLRRTSFSLEQIAARYYDSIMPLYGEGETLNKGRPGKEEGKRNRDGDREVEEEALVMVEK